jgi:hypothetical protein
MINLFEISYIQTKRKIFVFAFCPVIIRLRSTAGWKGRTNVRCEVHYKIGWFNLRHYQYLRMYNVEWHNE